MPNILAATKLICDRVWRASKNIAKIYGQIFFGWMPQDFINDNRHLY